MCCISYYVKDLVMEAKLLLPFFFAFIYSLNDERTAVNWYSIATLVFFSCDTEVKQTQKKFSTVIMYHPINMTFFLIQGSFTGSSFAYANKSSYRLNLHSLCVCDKSTCSCSGAVCDMKIYWKPSSQPMTPDGTTYLNLP